MIVSVFGQAGYIFSIEQNLISSFALETNFVPLPKRVFYFCLAEKSAKKKYYQ